MECLLIGKVILEISIQVGIHVVSVPNLLNKAQVSVTEYFSKLNN